MQPLPEDGGDSWLVGKVLLEQQALGKHERNRFGVDDMEVVALQASSEPSQDKSRRLTPR
jgi:hypothetical protein